MDEQNDPNESLDQQNQQPPMQPTQPETKPVENHSDSQSSKPHDHHRAILLGLIAAFLIVIGLSVAFLLSENSEENAQEAASVGTQTAEPIVTVNLDNVQTVWDDQLEAQLLAYDETNDNVDYEFGDDSFTVTGNGLPNHETGEFPNESNPNTISEQDVNYTISRMPVYSGEKTEVRIYGITVGGIPIEPGTAETDAETGWNIEAFNPSDIFGPGVDFNNAHVQPNGTYHYHGVPTSVITSNDDEHSNLVGFAADGFPVYAVHGYSAPTDSSSEVVHLASSWQLKQGQRGEGEPEGIYTGDYTQDYEYVAGSGDLDECNGRFSVTPEFPDGTYAYFFTEVFPYAGRCMMGEVAESFASTGGQPPQGPNGSQNGFQPPSNGQAPPQ